MSKLHRLSTINFAHNLIDSISSCDFSQMIALQTIDLSGNKMIDNPIELGLCNKLKDVTLNDNPYKDKKFIKLLGIFLFFLFFFYISFLFIFFCLQYFFIC